jgi:hypothetical protein
MRFLSRAASGAAFVVRCVADRPAGLELEELEETDQVVPIISKPAMGRHCPWAVWKPRYGVREFVRDAAI